MMNYIDMKCAAAYLYELLRVELLMSKLLDLFLASLVFLPELHMLLSSLLSQ